MLYSYLKNSNANGIWTPIWSMPDNIWVASSALTDSGTCGFNSICTLESDRRPILKDITMLQAMDAQNIRILRKKMELQRLGLQRLLSTERCRIVL